MRGGEREPYYASNFVTKNYRALYNSSPVLLLYCICIIGMDKSMYL